ncbi:response regulator [Kiritimatiellaeota bacterium B1221]|nr:response regulator [Kiritimatiellaeota bacterium B1221]
MIKALLIDDEILGSKALKTLLDKHSDVKVLNCVQSITDALRDCQKCQPDVIFLDIHLRGETGFDFLGQLPEPWPRIVFVTAYDRYAVKAFEANALDYLLKPVEASRLSQTLERIRSQQFPPLPEVVESDRVMVKVDNELKWISWSHILHLRSDGNYTHLTLEEGKCMMVAKTLKEWLQLAPSGFEQIHRQHLVQIEKIQSVHTYTRGQKTLKLSNQNEVPVGRSYWAELKNKINPSLL